jgi:ribosomal protein L44E
MGERSTFMMRVRHPAIVMFILGASLIFVTSRFGPNASEASAGRLGLSQSRRPQKKVATPKKPRIDYTKFSHQTHAVTQKLACSSCHKVPSKNWKEVRKGDAAFPDVSDFPEHASCLTCHREQFFARERPAPAICANCHVNNSPKDTSRWLFPSLGDVNDPLRKRRVFVSEFGVGFPHDKHIDVVGFNAPSGKDPRGWFMTVSLQEKKKDGPPKSCPVCHQTYQPQGNASEEFVTKPPKSIGDAFWLKKGTFKTTPNSHTVCFTCHSADSGIAPAPTDCNICHKLAAPETLKVDFEAKLASTMGITDATMLSKWSRRISAGAFRHEGGEHPDLNCMGCHNIPTMNTLDAKTLKVPVRSCGGADGCHVTATTDDGGALNFEIDQKKKDATFACTKCHITFGKEGIPADHPTAIPTPKPKVRPSS